MSIESPVGQEEFLMSGNNQPPVEAGSVTTELALRQMSVTVPSEPLTINGEPYAISINNDRLLTLVNAHAEGSNSRLIPRSLVVSYAPDPVTINIDGASKPTPTDVQQTMEDERLKWLPERNGTELRINLPASVNSDTYTTAGLAQLTVREANSYLVDAIAHVDNASSHFSASKRITTLVLGAVTGETAGMLYGEKVIDRIVWGLGGSVVGAAAVIAWAITIDRIHFQGNYDNLPNFVIKRTANIKKISHSISMAAKEGPIITLVPVDTDGASDKPVASK